MSTSTLLVIVGCVVALKTCAFVWYVVRRGRRQRLELAAEAGAVSATAAAAPASGDLSGWRLQWAEPGVMLLENVDDLAPARDVELAATLTASSGAEASLVQQTRFVGTGACFTARFAAVDSWLTACTLSYSMAWRTPDGERRRESRVALAVVPLPDLSFEAA